MSEQQRTISFTVDADSDRQRLDDFLAGRLGALSRMRIRRLIAEGGCRINGIAREAGRRLASGDIVEVDRPAPTPGSMTPDAIELECLYEDDDIIVVVKPSGMLVHPTLGVKRGTLCNALVYHFNRHIFDRAQDEASEGGPSASTPPPLVRPGLAHRLDKATSGLMAVAKSRPALSTLSRHFSSGLVSKRYLALVAGQVKNESGSVSAPIGPGEGPRWEVTSSGKEAETRWRVLGRSPSATLLEMEPVSGRTNQLRVHAAHMGHPILGDELYGGEAAAWAPRLFLHAWRLAFHHPRDGRWLDFACPLPPDLAKHLAEIGIESPAVIPIRPSSRNQHSG